MSLFLRNLSSKYVFRKICHKQAEQVLLLRFHVKIVGFDEIRLNFFRFALRKFSAAPHKPGPYREKTTAEIWGSDVGVSEITDKN